MATARPPGGGDTPQATIGFDYSSLRNAPNVARQAAQATAREMQQVFRAAQAEQRVALEQQRQTTAVVRAQQAQITATTRAESSIRVTTARAEAQAQQQAARVASNTRIEEERRLTAQVRSELRVREAEQRASLRANQAAQRGTLLSGGNFGQLAGTLGVAFGASQVVQAVVAGERLATTYDRQLKAAARLAGGQQQLNELLEAYRRSTGGIISDAPALQQVLTLQATGMADNAEELERFALAVRGSAMASGRPTDQVAFYTQMEIFNATNQRLNEIGLSYEKVVQRTEELRRTSKGMTDEQIRQEVILGLLIEQYGDLAKEPATALEQLGTTWDNQTLAISRATSGVVDFMATGINEWLKTTQRDVEFVRDTWEQLNTTIRNMPNFRLGEVLRAAAGSGASPSAGWGGSGWSGGGAGGGGGGGGGTGGFGGPDSALPTGRFQGTEDQQGRQQALVNQRFMARNQISRDANRALVETQRDYETQRSRTISQFEQSRSDEAQDFARKRLNDERRFSMSLLDIAQDSARQRVRWEADTARAIEEARAERDERINESSEDSAERIAEIEEKHNRDREKRQRDFARSIREAAANLDAVQVRELQRQQREENEEAARARDEAVSDERESLQERIDEANEAFAEQEADQRAALQRRIDLQAEDDRLRIQEMQDAWEEQKTQEDIERRIRLQRQADHHQAQLDQMDEEHEADIQQIKDQAQDERDQLEEEFKTAMVEAGGRLKAWEDYLRLRETAANASFDRVYGHMMDRFNNVTGPAGHPSRADPYTDFEPPAGSTFDPVMRPGMGNMGNLRNVSIDTLEVNIIGGTTMGASEFRPLMYEVIADVMEDLANQ